MNADQLKAKGYIEINGVWEKPAFLPPIKGESESVHVPVERESKLHDAIVKFCFERWPRWKIIFARTDKKSTLPVGCHDMTIFASNERVYCFELKAKNNKPDKDQRIWHKELEVLGHKVHTIYDFETFLGIVK